MGLSSATLLSIHFADSTILLLLLLVLDWVSSKLLRAWEKMRYWRAVYAGGVSAYRTLIYIGGEGGMWGGGESLVNECAWDPRVTVQPSPPLWTSKLSGSCTLWRDYSIWVLSKDIQEWFQRGGTWNTFQTFRPTIWYMLRPSPWTVPLPPI